MILISKLSIIFWKLQKNEMKSAKMQCFLLELYKFFKEHQNNTSPEFNDCLAQFIKLIKLGRKRLNSDWKRKKLLKIVTFTFSSPIAGRAQLHNFKFLLSIWIYQFITLPPPICKNKIKELVNHHPTQFPSHHHHHQFNFKSLSSLVVPL